MKVVSFRGKAELGNVLLSLCVWSPRSVPLGDWQLQAEWSAQSQAMHTCSRYQIHLWKQVSCDDLLGDVQIRFGWKFDSAFSPRHCSLTCRLLGFQVVSPAVQVRAKPGATGASIICAVVVERLAAWHDVCVVQLLLVWWSTLRLENSTVWGISDKNYKTCLWVSLLIQGKYSMMQPLNNINSRAYVPRLSLIHGSRKGLYPSDYFELWKCSCSALYSAWGMTWSALQAWNQGPVNLSVPWQVFGLLIVCFHELSQKDSLASAPLPPITSQCSEQIIFS